MVDSHFTSYRKIEYILITWFSSSYLRKVSPFDCISAILFAYIQVRTTEEHEPSRHMTVNTAIEQLLVNMVGT